jgi:hypothetical protein
MEIHFQKRYLRLQKRNLQMCLCLMRVCSCKFEATFIKIFIFTWIHLADIINKMLIIVHIVLIVFVSHFSSYSLK